MMMMMRAIEKKTNESMPIDDDNLLIAIFFLLHEKPKVIMVVGLFFLLSFLHLFHHRFFLCVCACAFWHTRRRQKRLMKDFMFCVCNSFFFHVLFCFESYSNCLSFDDKFFFIWFPKTYCFCDLTAIYDGVRWEKKNEFTNQIVHVMMMIRFYWNLDTSRLMKLPNEKGRERERTMTNMKFIIE